MSYGLSAQIPYLGKFSFSSFMCKSSRPIRSLDFQITISFEPFKPYRQNTIRHLRWCCHFSVKMPFYPEKGQKGAKVGRAVGQNQLFCILLNIGSLIFLIFCMKLEIIKGYKLTRNTFLKKIIVLQIFGHFWLKISNYYIFWTI